ncbi:substrate-binding periplasmic protein [Roseateles koreensis]|uniref:Transporter substrate-binding domain-containing protein n=1 Tax=Roseateles koreensis TaxID=2987526 RepID=A0ABT5KU27_9BURK|nr:transporter substrate-binding domain-containing protein [Roseateles koreensis]MDC8786450.1 transporter substrate-binding domain-containing protein [Roseateles koreensis]
MGRRLLALLVGLMLVGAARADEIVLASPEYWCPFSCKAGSAQEGFAVDIIRAIFTAEGHRVRLVNENYSRALLDVRAGIYTATPSTFHEEAPDFVFPDVPVTRNRFCVYAKVGSAWSYTGTASLTANRIGIIKDYAYGPAWDQLMKQEPKRFDLHAGDDLSERMIRRLMLDRIDAFVEEENLISYTLKQHPKLAARVAGCDAPTYAYMAISPKLAKAQGYAQIFSTGMLKLRKSGRLAEILARYGVPEWSWPSHP